MKHEQLWAPWRLGYIQGNNERAGETEGKPKPADSGCFICNALAVDADRENLVVERGRANLALLNRYPYNNGHLLIAPLAHRARLDEIAMDARLEAQEMIARYVSLIEQLMNAQGFNIGLNLGHVAGAGLPGHLHWHIVPRWQGDTNFMPVLGGVGVIPQSLEALWETLTEANAERT